MGVVYLAEDTELDRQVAIKISTEASGPRGQQLRMRFRRELKVIAKLSHRNIAIVHDGGKTPDGQLYIVMELLKGKMLGDLIEDGSLTIERVVEIILAVAEALAEAHRHGVVHRDIKPSNIAINEHGDVKVLDFGLAKYLDDTAAANQVGENSVSNGVGEDGHPNAAQDGDLARHSDPLPATRTSTGVIVCTPEYASPEQAMGCDDVDARSDLFSLGSVLYECLTGTRPFSGPSPNAVRAKVIRDDPPPPSALNPLIPPDLDRITLKALAKKPEARYQSAAEMFADLRSTDSVSQPQDSLRTVPRVISPVGATRPIGALNTLSDILKRPRLSLGYVAAALFLLGLIGFVSWRVTRPTVHRPSDEVQRLYDKGIKALHDGAYYQASGLFARAVAADDKFALAHARLAETFTELDYTDKAKTAMLTASRLVGDRAVLSTSDAIYFDAISATVLRDQPAAINSYAAIVKLQPSSAAALMDLGRAFESNDEMGQAIEQYSNAANLDKDNPAPLLRMAVLYGRQQNLTVSNAAFDRADNLYKDNQNFEGRAEVAYQRGYLLSQRGELKEARNIAQQTLDMAKLADNKYQQVRALLLLSAIAYSSGDTAQGQQLAMQGLELARNNDMESLTTQGLLDLGYALMIQRSYAESEQYLKQAFELAQRYKEKRNEARANLLLGTLYIQQEDADRGAPFIDEALKFYRAGGYRREISRCMMMVGRGQLLKGDFDGAVKTLDEQLQLAKQVEDPGQLARSQEELAPALSKQSLYPQALARFTESYQTYKSLNNSFHAAFALLNRADMLAQLGGSDEAQTALNELRPYIDSLRSDNNYKEIWSAWTYLIRARIALSQNNFSDTVKMCNDALAALTPKNNISIATTMWVLGLAQIRSGMIEIGTKTISVAVSIAISTRDARTVAEARLALAEALLASGTAKQALSVALLAQEGLAALHMQEGEWRAWLIAAQSSGKLKDTQRADEQLGRAQNVLDQLRAKWGEVSFRTYIERSDNRIAEKQLIRS